LAGKETIVRILARKRANYNKLDKTKSNNNSRHLELVNCKQTYIFLNLTINYMRHFLNPSKTRHFTKISVEETAIKVTPLSFFSPKTDCLLFLRKDCITSYFISFAVDKCANCDINADCIYGRCRCRKGYIGTGYVCEKSK